jgi:chromosomal replication initiation ATPase DnaA
LHKQTSFNQQTLEKRTINPQWEEVLAYLKRQMPQRTFAMFLGDTGLPSIEDGVIVITTTTGYAKDWIEARLGNKIKHALKVEGIRRVVLTE